jgi:hypothetical protein
LDSRHQRRTRQRATARLTETLSVLKNLENEVPFGGSAMFDALIASSRFLSKNELDNMGKVIYVFTDNEANMSVATIDQAIEEVNAIDGFQQTPIVAGNFAVVSPITLSAKANITDTNTLNKLDRTRRAVRASPYLSADFEDETVQIFTGEAIGSLGYGEATINVDLGSVVGVNEMTAFFQLYENTTGRWRVEYSENGYVFTDLEGHLQGERHHRV